MPGYELGSQASTIPLQLKGRRFEFRVRDPNFRAVLGEEHGEDLSQPFRFVILCAYFAIYPMLCREGGRCLCQKRYGTFRKLGVPYFGVLIIRILLFRLLYWGPLFSETPLSLYDWCPRPQKLPEPLLSPGINPLSLQRKQQDPYYH